MTVNAPSKTVQDVSLKRTSVEHKWVNIQHWYWRYMPNWSIVQLPSGTVTAAHVVQEQFSTVTDRGAHWKRWSNWQMPSATTNSPTHELGSQFGAKNSIMRSVLQGMMPRLKTDMDWLNSAGEHCRKLWTMGLLSSQKRQAGSTQLRVRVTACVSMLHDTRVKVRSRGNRVHWPHTGVWSPKKLVHFASPFTTKLAHISGNGWQKRIWLPPRSLATQPPSATIVVLQPMHPMLPQGHWSTMI